MLDRKREIRYIGFVSTDDGGRRFDFYVKAADQEQIIVTVDIPGILFAGTSRIMVQEAAGICSAKIKELCDAAGVEKLPTRLLLTGHDVGQLREPPKSARRVFQRS